MGKPKLQPIQVSSVAHKRAKIGACKAGESVKDWVGLAITEKLLRDFPEEADAAYQGAPVPGE